MVGVGAARRIGSDRVARHWRPVTAGRSRSYALWSVCHQRRAAVATSPVSVPAAVIAGAGTAVTGLGWIATGASVVGVGATAARKQVDDDYSDERCTADLALGGRSRPAEWCNSRVILLSQSLLHRGQ